MIGFNIDLYIVMLKRQLWQGPLWNGANI